MSISIIESKGNTKSNLSVKTQVSASITKSTLPTEYSPPKKKCKSKSTKACDNVVEESAKLKGKTVHFKGMEKMMTAKGVYPRRKNYLTKLRTLILYKEFVSESDAFKQYKTWVNQLTLDDEKGSYPHG